MSLKQWAENGWLRPHRSSRREIDGLMSIVDRDLRDAGRTGLSADWRFGIAYSAALKLCTILLHVSGYRPERNLQHYRTLQALPLILGKEHQEDTDYLETCRIKRNTLEYETAGGLTEKDASELIEFVGKLKPIVQQWMRTNHPDLK